MVHSLIPFRHRNSALFGFPTDVERWIDSVFPADHVSGERKTQFAPRLNIAESEDNFEISVELPGLDPADVNVEVNQGQLTISGETASATEDSDVKDGKKTYHRIERRYGKFLRRLALPDAVNQDQIDASFANGVLQVRLPKRAEVKPQQIEVKGVS